MKYLFEVHLCAIIIRYIGFAETGTYVVARSCSTEVWSLRWQLHPESGPRSRLHPSLPSAGERCLWWYCRRLKPPRTPNWPRASCSLVKQQSRTKTEPSLLLKAQSCLTVQYSSALFRSVLVINKEYWIISKSRWSKRGNIKCQMSSQ